MNALTTWILAVVIQLTASTNSQRLRVETQDQMTARYTSIAEDLSEVLISSAPLFTQDDNRVKTAALMLSIANWESGFTREVDGGRSRGDKGASWCLMQINLPGRSTLWYGTAEMRKWDGVALSSDRKKCFIAGLEQLRISITRCPAGPNGAPLNMYVTGRCDRPSLEAKHRWDMAKWLERRAFPVK